MLTRKIIFILFCSFAGGGIASGYVAFITLLGVFERLLEKIKAAKYARIIEWLIILGVTCGNFFFIMEPHLKLGINTYALFNLIGGIFTGCLAGALAETLKVFPILSRRFKVVKYLPYVLIAAALGKALGCYINLMYIAR